MATKLSRGIHGDLGKHVRKRRADLSEDLGQNCPFVLELPLTETLFLRTLLPMNGKTHVDTTVHGNAPLDTQQLTAGPADRSTYIRLLDLVQAGVALGDISRAHLYNLLGEGQLQDVYIGKRRMITLASIDDYITRQINAARNAA